MTVVFNPARFLMLGFDGQEPTDQFLKLIDDNPPAGFLFLGHNYHDPEQLRSLVAGLKSACRDKTVFAVDQEPGRVQRLKGTFPISRKPSYYLKQGSLTEFRTWCDATADMMAMAGLNMNLAPVVDLFSNASENSALRDRTFGDNPERVSEFAEVLIEEFRSRGIATCAKHFPGLGCGAGDPHEMLTRSDETLEGFLDYHWRPFRSVVKAGVDCIMTTHILAPAIDRENCATYSRNAIGHLRNTLGHRGPIISDDLCMSGAETGDPIGQAAEKALYAGHNLLIISRTIELQIQAIDSMRRRYDVDPAFMRLASENEIVVDAFRNVL